MFKDEYLYLTMFSHFGMLVKMKCTQAMKIVEPLVGDRNELP